ncbi:MAG: restriction endonuclease [Chloroflexi bacterium]|nr:restriction endonuclease [Chloroflexota bacterium]
MREENGLPPGWVRTTVGDIYEVIGGGTPSTEKAEFWNGTIPWITSADIHGPKNVEPRKAITYKAIENSATNLVPKDSILVVTRVGLGKVGLAPTQLCFSQDMQGLIGNNDFIFPDYVLYFLSEAVQAFKFTSRGTTIPGVTKNQLKQLDLLLPPNAEQHRIVAKIEELFPRLDAGVAALQRARANLKRYRAAVLKAAVEGRLTAEWRQAHLPQEPAAALLQRILAERRLKWEEEQAAKFAAAGKAPPPGWQEKYKEPAPPDTAGLPGLPEGWCWASLETLASAGKYSISSGPFGSNLGTKDYKDSGVPIIRGKNVKNGRVTLDDLTYISEEKAKQLERSLARPRDLIVVAVGSSGHPAIVPDYLPRSILSQNCNKITLDESAVLPEYAVITMQTEVVQRQLVAKTTDTARPFLSLTNLMKTVIPLPPVELQRRIAAEVDQQFTLADSLEKSITANIARASRLRQSILKRAFAGKLVPQDAADEPARVLLERIRAEREAGHLTPVAGRAAAREAEAGPVAGVQLGLGLEGEEG